KNNLAPNIGLAWDVLGNGRASFRAGYSISYVNDETLNALTTSASNEGLAATSSGAGLSGRISSGLPTIPVPGFNVPRTFQQNFQLNPLTAFGLPDAGLSTPYVQEWSAGLQTAVKDTVFELRYVGNHSTKLFRSFDVNPEVIVENGFLDDFKRALSNGNLGRA